jgi:hypothetical protein
LVPAAKGSGLLHFDGWLALLRVILHLVAGDMEATDKRTKGNETGRFGGD